VDVVGTVWAKSAGERRIPGLKVLDNVGMQTWIPPALLFTVKVLLHQS